MKRSTAVKHLQSIGAETSKQVEAWPDIQHPESLWIADDILDAPDTLNVITILVRVDVPVKEFPWRTLNRLEVAISESLRLDKLPIWRHGRPSSWPAWNAENRRVRRFWHITEGTDTEVIETLRAGRPVEPVAIEPHVFIDQMRTEYRCHAPTSTRSSRSTGSAIGGRSTRVTAATTSTRKTTCGVPPTGSNRSKKPWA